MKTFISTPDIDSSDHSNIVYFGEWTRDPKYKSLIHSNEIYEFKRSLNFTNNTNNLYLKKLNAISSALNFIHNKKLSIRNWEVLIGPWLRISIDIFKERFDSIREIESFESDPIFLSVENKKNKSAPFDMYNFIMDSYNHSWNNALYGMIAKNVKYVKKESPKNLNLRKFDTNYSLTLKPKKNIFNQTLKRINANRNIIHGLSGPYLWRRAFKFFFCSIPIKDFISKNKKEFFYNYKSREKFKKEVLKNFIPSDNFEELLSDFLVDKMPILYLEAYTFIYNEMKNINIPTNPKFVLTSTAHWFDDNFKFWLSNNLNKESKYCIYQHGGTYGTTDYIFQQEYIEKRTCDKFISWGWKYNNSTTIKGSMPFFIPIINFSIKENLLIICPRVKMYSKGDPWDSFHWNKKFLADSLNFIVSTKKLKNCKVKFRTHPSQNRFGINIENYFSEQGQRIVIDQNRSLKKSISRAKVCIVTINSTSFLECLVLNRPTIAFWNQSILKTNKKAKPYFDKLIKAKILHESSEQAYKHLNKVWKNPYEWWKSDLVKESLDSFLSQYASLGLFKSIKSVKKTAKH